MKSYNSILLISCLWLVNCTTKDNNNQSKESATEIAIEKPKVEQIFDLDGEIVWEQNGRIIKSINEDKPKTLFLNFKSVDDYGFRNIKLAGNKTGQIVSGKISLFGDLNQDEIPEFLIDDITESKGMHFGFRMVINIAIEKIKILKSVRINASQNRCSNIVGQEIILEYDSLLDDGPYLVQKSKFGFLEGEDCKNYEQAVSTTYYSLPSNSNELQPIDRSECPIENNVINLASLYSINKNYWDNSPFQSGYYWGDFKETIVPKLIACGDKNSSLIAYINNLAGINLIGGNAQKRIDLIPHIEDEFYNINPDFIKWAREKLIPAPNQKQINGLTYGFIFRKSGKFTLDNYAKVRLLIEQEDKETLLREYVEAKATINNNSPHKETPDGVSNLIMEKYDWVNNQLEKNGLEGTNNFIYYGFWMRRMLDGSEPEIWETLKYILKMYDADWYAETNLFGLVEIDSDTYQNASLASINDSVIVSKQSIPEGILVETETDFTITAKNGKVVHYLKTDNSMDMETNYYVSGYWPQKKKVIIGWDDDEQVGYYTIDITSGSKNRLEGKIFPSKEGNYLATFKEELDPSSSEYETITSLKLTKNGQLIEEYTGYFVRDGFWINDEFYFASNNKRYKVGKLGFDDIKPYSPPIIDTIIKTDSITSSTEE